MTEPIDAVILWVDGNDEALKRKRHEYAPDYLFNHKDSAGATRFADIGEIHCCVKSINRFAPWFRKIYIITDGQDPKVKSDIPVEIVDHKVIFRGYEQYLPVFNSNAIEAMIWRIPGLSGKFVLFNDDFMLAGPVVPEDFFLEDGKVVCYAFLRGNAWTRFTRIFKRKKDNIKPFTFKGALMNSSVVAGGGHYYVRLNHTPHALLVKCFEDFYGEHPEALLRNISHRFRTSDDYVTHAMHHKLLHMRGMCKMVHPSKVLFYYEPKDKKDYTARKLEKLQNGNYKFCCFNSLDQASPEDLALVKEWIESRLDGKA